MSKLCSAVVPARAVTPWPPEFPSSLIYNHEVSRKDLNESFSHEFTRDACVVSSIRGSHRGCRPCFWLRKHVPPGCHPDQPHRTGPAASVACGGISSPSPTTAGIATIIDYAGDTIVAQAPIGPGPLAFSLDENGTTGYTVNSDGTLTNFPVSNQLQEKNVTYSTLPAASQSVGLFSPSAGLWVADLNGNVADVLTGSPETFKLSIPVAPTPIEIVGSPVLGQHNYALSLNTR